MVSPPRVSVIVPVLDARATVLKALESALDQDVEVEVLVIDDGSCDDTPGAVSRLGDPRIRLLTTGMRRSGPSNARNVGLAAAEGEWIAVLDADDRFAPGRLPDLLQSAREWDADLIVDDIWMETPESREGASLFSRRHFAVEDGHPLHVDEVVRLDLGLLKPLVRRSLLESRGIQYRARGRATEDFAFLFDCTIAAQCPIAVPRAGYVYIKRQGSVSSWSTGFWLDSLGVTAEVLRDHASIGASSRRALEHRMRQAENRYHYLRAREATSSADYLHAASRLLAHPGAAAFASRAAVQNLNERLRRGGRR